MTPRDLTRKLNLLVAEASTTMDHEQKLRLIQEALKIACVFIKTLKPQLRDALRDSIERLPAGTTGLTLTIKDLSFKHDELKAFRSANEFSDFLDSTLDVLEEQQFLSRQKLVEVFAEFKRTYETMAETKLDEAQLNQIVSRLENFYCRPPYGGGGLLGEPKPDPDGSGGGSETKTTSALNMMSLLAGIGSFIIQVGEKLWPLIFAEDAPPRERDELPREWEVLVFASLNGLLGTIEQEFGVELTSRPRVQVTGAYA